MINGITATGTPHVTAAADIANEVKPDSAVVLARHMHDLARMGTFDPTRLRFRMMMEVKGDAGRYNRLLGTLGWSAAALTGDSHRRGGDCSHKKDGGGASFAHQQSGADHRRRGAATDCRRLPAPAGGRR